MARQVIAVQDVQGQVLDVQGVPTKSGKVKYDVAFSDGKKYSTFALALAEQAAAVKGQPCTLRIEVSQNGQYTNYDLSEVNPQTPAPASIQAPQVVGSIGSVQVGAPATSGISMQAPRDFEQETRGKVRHGAIIAGLDTAARTSQGESDPDLFQRAVLFAQAIESYVFGEDKSAAQAVVDAPAPTVEAIVETGLVQVGTAGIAQPEAQASGGLPWSQQAS